MMEEKEENNKNLNKKNDSNSQKILKSKSIEIEHSDDQPEFYTLTNIKTQQSLDPKPEKQCFLSELFFCQFNNLMRIGSTRGLRKEEMNPLPEGINIKTLLPKALEIKDQLPETAPPKVRGVYRKLKRLRRKLDITTSRTVQAIIFKLIKPKIVRACILKILEQVTLQGIALIPMNFLPQLKKPPDQRKNYVLILSPIIAFLLTFLRGMFKEHCAKFLNQCGSTAGQTLRALFYDKLINSNISFLNNADSSIIAKITLFEMNKIVDFIGKVPEIISFPASLLLSIISMVYFTSRWSILSLLIFIVLYFILLFLAKRQSDQNIKKEYFLSRRTSKVQEILRGMKEMKCSSMESYLNQSIKDLRSREARYIMLSNNLKILSNFFISMSPIAATCTFLMIEYQLKGRPLTVTETYAIVSIVGNLSKPLREFVTNLDDYYYYKYAARAINKLLFVFSLRPDDAEIDPLLPIGEINIENCQVEVEDEVAVVKNLEKVFGEKLNIEKELIMSRERREKRGKQLRDSSIFSRINSGSFKKSEKSLKILEKKKNSKFMEKLKRGVKSGLRSVKSMFITGKKKNQVMDIRRKKIISGISLKITPGEKICLYSSENEGVTELLYALMGEAYITEGYIKYNGKIAYIEGRNPSFLPGNTLRENILLGAKFNKTKYKNILKVLKFNVNKFKGGDMVQVLSNGVNFSVAEKTKILLARIMYQENKDIYIIDNLFSKNQPELTKMLYSKIVNGFFSTKTVIIRSSSHIVGKMVDRLIFFKNKKINFNKNPKMFNFEKLSQVKNYHKIMFQSQVKSILLSNQVGKVLSQGKMENRMDALKHKTMTKYNRYIANEFLDKSITKRGVAYLNMKKLLEEQGIKNEIDKFLKIMAIGVKQLPEQLEKGFTTKRWNERPIYKDMFKMVMKYIFYNGKGRILILFLVYALSISLFLLVDLWAGAWSFNLFNFSSLFYTLSYIGLALLAGFFVIIRDNVYYAVALGHTNKIHDTVMKKLLKLQLKWFNQIRELRIEFKLSYDIDILDSKISYYLQEMLETSVFIILGMVILNWVYFGIMFLVTIVLYIYFSSVFRKYLYTIQSLVAHRSESIAKVMTIYNYINCEALNYRLMGKTKILEKAFMNTSNEYQRETTHIAFYCSRWLGVRMIVINTTLITIAYIIPLIFVYWLGQTFFERTILELAFATSWTLKITGYFNRYINAIAKVYSNIDSFGKMKFFIDECEVEDFDSDKILPFYEMLAIEEKQREEVEDKIPLRFDFRKGLIIHLKNVKLTLSGRSLLKGIDLRVTKGENLVLIGDEDSGRNILFDVILKLYNRDQNKEGEEGFLKIFGKEIETQNPRLLRGKIGYGEGNPSFFSGTVREIIDPDYAYSEDELINILEAFGAGEFIKMTKIDNKVVIILEGAQYNKYSDHKRFKTRFQTIMQEPLLKNSTTLHKNFEKNGNDFEDKEKKNKSDMKRTNEENGGDENENNEVLDLKFHVKPHESDESAQNEGKLETEGIEEILKQELEQEENEQKRIIYESEEVSIFEEELFKERIKTEKDEKKPDYKSKDLKKFFSAIRTKIPIPITESKNRGKFKYFLKKYVNTKLNQFSIKLRRLLNIVKLCLQNPEILLLHQEALKFNSKRMSEIIKTFQTNCTKNVTCLVIMNDFADILSFDRVVMLKKGKVAEEGKIRKLLMRDSSLANQLIKKVDPILLEYLREKIGKELKFESQIFEEEANDIQDSELNEKIIISDRRLL